MCRCTAAGKFNEAVSTESDLHLVQQEEICLVNRTKHREKLMSEINCFGTEQVLGEIVPGWWLVRLVEKHTDRPYLVNGFEMKDGDYGITCVNDPDFVLSMPPLDPDNPDDESRTDEEDEVFSLTLRHYEERLTGPVDVCGRFYVDCCKAGYDPEEGGFVSWVMQRCHRIHRNIVQVYPAGE